MTRPLLMPALAAALLLPATIAGAERSVSDELPGGSSITRKGNQLTIKSPRGTQIEHRFGLHANQEGCAMGRVEIAFSQGRVGLKEQLDRSTYYRTEGHSAGGFLMTVGAPNCQVTIEVRPKR